MGTTQEANRPDLSLAPPKASVMLERYALLAFLVVMLGFAALASPAFLQPANLLNVLTIAAPLGMVVLGQTFALLVRGLDLSVASLMATVAVLATAFRASSNDMIPAIFVAAIVFSALVGLINGWLITKRGVSPFLATLATMIILQGAPVRLYRRRSDQHPAAWHANARDRPLPGPANQPLDARGDGPGAWRAASQIAFRPRNLHGGRQPEGCEARRSVPGSRGDQPAT